MYQQDLKRSGSVTGYFFDDISTAVLSIPSFRSDIEAFSEVLGDFVGNATEAGAKKVIIDLQQNNGGQAELALEAFRWVGIPRIEVSMITS